MQILRTKGRSAVALGAASVFAALASTTALAAGGYADLVDDVSPAVVFVEVTAAVQKASAEAAPLKDPRFEEFMERFGGELAPRGRGTPGQGVGSADVATS